MSIGITLHFTPDCTTSFQDSVYKTLEMVKFVGSNKTACGCIIRTRHELPCACELAGLQIQGDHIPLESIHVFRKKLYIKEHEVTNEDSGTQLNLEEKCEELNMYFITLDIVGQRVMRKKFRN